MKMIAVRPINILKVAEVNEAQVNYGTVEKYREIPLGGTQSSISRASGRERGGDVSKSRDLPGRPFIPVISHA